MSVKMNRRQFLYTTALGAAGAILAACGGTKTAETPAPAATKAPEATAPKPQATAIPTRSATATPVPTLAAAKYKEAPMLAEMVKAGKLPPVEERVPMNPLVLSPIHQIGNYGGRLRTFSGWIGFWDECQYGHSPLRWIDDGLGIAPGMCEAWETNADNTEWTIYFRKGLKWSDGEPCTVDDVMFWWNDMVLDPDQSDNPPDFGQTGTDLAEFIKVDDYTLKIKYVVPAPLTAYRLAMWVNGLIGPRWITPAHYMKQFHPKYTTDYKDFEEFNLKIQWRQNPDCPSLTSWVCEKFEADVSSTWVRNAYYYAVDTEGNQLPYIDYLDNTHIGDAEVQKLTIMNGDIDFVHFGPGDLKDVSTFKENEAKGGYETRFWDSGSGTGAMFFWNNDHPDEKIRAVYRNPKFKQAMSYAIDRPRVQKVVYYNTGVLTTGTMSPKAIEFNFNEEARAFFEEMRTAYVDYDLAKAKALLDEIGVVDADGDGWRELPDGSKFEVLFDIGGTPNAEHTTTFEIALEGWQAIGLNVIANTMPGAEFDTMWHAGQGSFRGNWEVGDGPNHLVYPSWVVPNETARWSPLSGKRFELIGTEKEDTETEKSPWDRQPPRFASTEGDLIGEPVWRLQELYKTTYFETDEVKRHHIVWEMVRIHKDDGPFYLGTVANYPRVVFVGNKMVNIPKKEELALGGFVNPWIIPYPAILNTETFSFK